MKIRQLTKEWITYLKTNSIVELTPDRSGNLIYRSQPTTDTLITFFDLKTDFDKEEYMSAMAAVLGKRFQSSTFYSDNQSSLGNNTVPQIGNKPQTGLSTWKHTEMRPGKRPTNRVANDAEDIEVKPKRINEAFKEPRTIQVKEDEVLEIFRMLVNGGVKVQQKKSTLDQESVNKLKSIIRNSLTPSQRKYLWQQLVSSDINEASLPKAAIKDIFSTAIDTRNNTGLGKFSKLFRKNNITLQDLHAAWAAGLYGEAYPRDSDDIKQILKSAGFSDKEIDKIFHLALGDINQDERAQGIVDRLVKVIADNNLQDLVRELLKTEFSNDIGKINEKLNYQQIKDIFAHSLAETRENRIHLVMSDDYSNLGRTRK